MGPTSSKNSTAVPKNKKTPKVQQIESHGSAYGAEFWLVGLEQAIHLPGASSREALPGRVDTPWKINMEPENHLFEKENHLDQTSMTLGSMLIFRGVVFVGGGFFFPKC